MNEIVELGAGELSVGLVPGIGGSVAHFRFAGVNLMRPLSEADQATGNVLGVAAFPMMPYANRIAGNAFDFEGRTFSVASNNGAEKFNVHGSGWKLPWSMQAQAVDEVLLALDVNDGVYAYAATQKFSIDPRGMAVTLTITNRGARRMPFGFGLHPWFERDADMTLQFAARRFYLEEPNGVAGDPITLPPELDFASARPLPARWRNNDYGGWDGVARIAYPSRRFAVVIRADPVFGHLMVYADPVRTFFCVEPQSNASGAFNRDGGMFDSAEGVTVLEPGQSAGGSIRFDVERL